MGSGSTGIACINTGRRFLGIELDDRYFNIAKNRVQDRFAEVASTLADDVEKE